MDAVSSHHSNNRIPSLTFALWVSLASISMMFAGFMSAYIVRQAAGNWFEFVLPSHFLWSTGVLLVSSGSIFLAQRMFNQRNEIKYKSLLVLTFVLGLVFIVLQYEGWMAMQAEGIDLKGNPSGAFVYVISGVHVAHVLGGLAVLVVALLHAFLLPFNVSEVRKERLERTAYYWHYVDLLWVVLFLFLNYYR